MNSSLRYPYVRRSTAHIDGDALQHLLLNERVWSNAFSKQPRNDDSRKQSKWATFIGYLQFVYEKSRVHYLFPIILLFAYSLLGGLIFWSIEKSHEEVILRDKCGDEYIGETARPPCIRIKEHLDGKRKSYDSTALGGHRSEEGDIAETLAANKGL
ncbi:hypothetical protein RB195_011762 [Necator americanus]|uniref:Uncharacterized protein n=1 Tax=Necator americanus TaxID=51031 RepID=A0ABR1D418_NECAM